MKLLATGWLVVFVPEIQRIAVGVVGGVRVVFGVTIVGVVMGVAGAVGVTWLDGSDAIEVAAGVVVWAIAVKVYGVPFVRPLIAQLPVELVITHVLEASEAALIVYDDGAGPRLGGVVTLIVADALPAVATSAAGGSTRYA